MCGGVYDKKTGELESKYYPFPMFPYTRICFIMSDLCTWARCVSSWSEYPDEVFACLKALYYDAFYLMIIAMYLNQVMPQKYGVPKHPLFFLEKFIKRNFSSIYPYIYIDEKEI